MFKIHDILTSYWGFTSFRPLQEEIIQSVLHGHDTLALMPTGGGKSLCYQIPALAQEGMCLVISPLIALMKDQVENIRKKGITAFAIYSGMTRKEIITTLKAAVNSNCKFLYVSPERLETSLFKEYLPGLQINLVAVDEAHCISQWGYDFRPPYLRIAALRASLPDVPVLALTASATPDVQRDICNKLKSPQAPAGNSSTASENTFYRWQVFRQSFERPNLSYSVYQVESKITRLIDILNKVPGSAIVYCRSRKRTREISDLLQLQNFSADFYHAGLPQEERNRKQEEWIKNKTRVIVCTTAFGMGIDKPDVRSVVHIDVPDCLENYYQEAGRAGRDGKRAFAVLLYDEKDIEELEQIAAFRYPSLKEIREVYQALANYLQIPSGSGEGEYFEFDMADFLRKFKLNSQTAMYSIKALEQDGWLSYNEQVFIPSTVEFTVNKDYLYEFEAHQPQLEPLIKTLLRSYDGIFDQPVYISETVVAQLLKKEKEEIIQKLHALHRYGIIDYRPLKDKPQILLLKPRIQTDYLSLDMAGFNKRKEKFILRVKEMTRYLREKAECRSRIIGNYFGDMNIRSCGICDNCLRLKTIPISKEEFDTIHQSIINTVKYEPLPARDLLVKLSRFKKEKTWKVMEFLQAENAIEMDKQGRVRLK